MQRYRLLAAVGLIAVIAPLSVRANAQNEAPFTIRRPPDGSTVREKVRVEIPLASIPEGGYVAFGIDGQFRVALTPTPEERQNMRPGQPYVFVWDTKAPVKVRGGVTQVVPKDGEHTISATLYVPTGKIGGSVAKQTSSVTIKVANKATTDPGAILLRYRFSEGSNRTYNRNGESVIVTGLSQGMQSTGDQELVAQKSKLLVAVEDKYASGAAIVRNKLTQLIIRQSGQETLYPSEQLPKSLYQELDPLGRVNYQNISPSFDQFANLGVPVETTLNLPELPKNEVRVGDKWVSEKVALDIPGTAPDKQPKVTLTSTLEDIEWEGGYPTAKIHQVYDSKNGGMRLSSLTFGNIEVDNPSLTYERDIYLAYRSGTLIRVTRKLEVTGKTSAAVSNPAAGGQGSSGAGPMPSAGMMGASGQMGRMGGGMAARMGMMGGEGPMMGSGGQMGAMGGRSGVTARGKMGAMGSGGMGQMMGRGGSSGMMGMMGRGQSSMSPGAMMGSGGMRPPAMGSGGMMGGGFTGAGSQSANSQITLRSSSNTELDRGAGESRTASR